MTSDLDIPKDFELADFETPVSTTQIRPIVWSTQKYMVAQMIALHGKSKAKISLETGVPLSTISLWLTHPEFKEYIKEVIELAASEMKKENISLLSKIVAARVEEAELNGSYASLSNKDTLEIIKELNAITEDDNKQEESNYAKLFGKLLVAASQNKPIEINN